jgi:hypothetical protein
MYTVCVSSTHPVTLRYRSQTVPMRCASERSIAGRASTCVDAILREERNVTRGRRRKVGFWLLAGLMAIIGIGMAIAVAQGWRTPSGRPDYVALGSSFAAGAGLGALEPGSPTLCARSVDGYPQQLARLRAVALVDMSCGGAVTRHLLHGGQYFQEPQVRTITRATRLVTLTIGGNDVGYVADLSMLAARHTNSLFGRLVRWFWDGPRRPDARGYGQLRSDLIYRGDSDLPHHPTALRHVPGVRAHCRRSRHDASGWRYARIRHAVGGPGRRRNPGRHAHARDDP